MTEEQELAQAFWAMVELQGEPMPYTFRVAVVPAKTRPGKPPITPSRHVYEVGVPGNPLMDPGGFAVAAILDTQLEAAALCDRLNRGAALPTEPADLAAD